MQPRRKICCLPIVFVMCAAALASDIANVAGAWAVSASMGKRHATQTLVIQQAAENISGTFKGPRQSGTLSGSVNGNAITIHVDAKTPLDYAGTVDGDTMRGSITGDGKSGTWIATRK